MESAARLLFHDEQGRMARLETIIAIMLEDEEWDISPILKDHLPELSDISDPRMVMQVFRDATLTVKGDIEDALEEEPSVELRMQAVDGVTPVISDALHREGKAWNQIELNLNLWVIRPVAEAIRAAVNKLAELLGQERSALRDEPLPPDIIADDGGKDPAAAPKHMPKPKNGFEPD